MKKFYKFHGTGNDFIMIDASQWKQDLNPGLIIQLCNRHTGIGADGLILIQKIQGYDFEMIYYNSDGSLARMCGNGARCAAAYAHLSGICGNKSSFIAGDGPHTASISKVSETEWVVDVSMEDVEIPDATSSAVEIDTGTRHLVIRTPDPELIDTITEGRKIRYSEKYASEGININWFNFGDDYLSVRTYERGVEAETLSCGTGVTATAIVAAIKTGQLNWNIVTKGGNLSVGMQRENNKMSNIRLTGPAKMVFKGELDMSQF
ncbi:MAG: diaminopimelate epimerase [Lentimicrobium sp.]|nr:diaminopimelate epimerase [Lentimicrobium sp.]